MSPSSQFDNRLPDISIFYGREREQKTLQQWIVKEQCRAIAIVGMEGIGKTTLAAKVFQSLAHEFDYMLWRSVRYAESFNDLLEELIKSLSNGKETKAIDNIDLGLSKLIGYLRESRCLVVLDDWQLAFRQDTDANRKEREYYNELLKRVSQISHQSCIIFNSDEKFEIIGLLEGKLVRCLSLQGLGKSAKAIFQEKGLQEEELWQQLIDNYRGNPQQLKLVSNIIKEVFGGRVSRFFQQQTYLNVVVDKTTEKRLEEQFNQLSPLEQQILQVVANAGQPLDLEQLRKSLSFNAFTSELTKAIASLGRRSLLEIVNDKEKQLFSLQPMVMKYVVREHLPETIIPSLASYPSAINGKQQPQHNSQNPATGTKNLSKVDRSEQNVSLIESQPSPAANPQPGKHPVSPQHSQQPAVLFSPEPNQQIPPQHPQVSPAANPQPGKHSVSPQHSQQPAVLFSPEPNQQIPLQHPQVSPAANPQPGKHPISPQHSQQPAVFFAPEPNQQIPPQHPQPFPAANPPTPDRTVPAQMWQQPPVINAQAPTSIVPSRQPQPSPAVDWELPTRIAPPQPQPSPLVNHEAPTSIAPPQPQPSPMVIPPQQNSANVFPSPANFLPSIGEHDFLPPISRWTKLGGMFIVGAVGIGFIVSAFTPYNVTVKADAKVRPTGELRIVEAETEGRIIDIKVKDNQVVKKREIIAIIDTSRSQTKKKQLKSDIQQAGLQIGRIDAQLQAHHSQILAETEQINRTINAAQAELNVARAKHTRYKQVASSGAISQNQVEEAELAVKQQEQNLAAQNAKGQATLASLRREKEALNQQKIEIEKKLRSDRSELEQIESELTQASIKAPVAGTLFQLKIRNPGQTVRPGDRIAQIAPSNNSMAIESLVSAQDISKIKTGQKAQVRISACPYPDYGTLKGSVQNVSPDVMSSENVAAGGTTNASTDRYKIMIKPDSLILSQGKKKCKLQVGMEGKADIIASEETVLQFLLRKAKLLADF
jgi:multidrug efflux pump subunit AcrA (membrane-fusion protein)